MFRYGISSLFLFVILISSSYGLASENVLKIYLDADRTRHTASAESIEKGIKTAFAEIDNMIQGYKVEFVALDHRGNSTRSKMNMDQAFRDPQALLVLAGLHSPPLIKNRAYINENKMLTLVPWAAGGPITRYPSEDNWVFRLSIDDTKAGYRIAQYAVEQGECQNPHLLLEQTPWGKSNKKTMSEAVLSRLKIEPQVSWFNWGLSEDSARIKLRHISDGGYDCIFFVGNANDGKIFSRAMLSIETARLPIYSHWGITGGDFHEHITADMRERLNLTFIQSCFSFVSSEPSEFSKAVFAKAQELYPDLKDYKSLKAPPGFIHAYDLGKVLIAALSQIELRKNMIDNRLAVKQALENLKNPVHGLIKKYNKPFSRYSENNSDAHDALGLDDFCMARYGAMDEILVFPR